FITQFYWIKKAYELENKIFDTQVKNALQDVAGSILRSNNNFSPTTNIVTKENEKHFIVQINDVIDPVSLENLLIRELKNQNISTDFVYGIYNCESDSIQHTKYVSIAQDTTTENSDLIKKFPTKLRENNYFGVLFPNRTKFLIGEMSNWLISTLVMLFILIILAYNIFIIFKQKRLSEIQKDFVNNMTHEFKTPLATIKISAEVLKNPAIIKNPQRLLNYATIISNETAHLTQQVERVLQMAKSTKDKIELNRENVNLVEIINSIVEKTKPLLRLKGGDIQATYFQDNIELKVDALHFKNAISNLIENGVKYSKNAPMIDINVAVEKNMIKISVKDNGIGISEENLKHIFERFYRVPTGNLHDVKGFGLGLNYVRLICEQHGGKISVSSELEKGSEFSIFIPKT
ncbi:MAG: HAMP domain-containing histidine kinase, partial [Chitinophagaceae bacterium]|nr:HAMP domain-containing histidine kinase [Chitinophagaceae bacterium]